MCGIALIASSQPSILESIIERMTDRLQHRGPDAQACVKLPNCQLGHTRLSIIDLAGGSQPMTEETERYWIVFNGEIYNYRELRQNLETQGWHFRTQSDTEVLLRTFQQYGERTPSLLNGQFAFAIWDQTEQQLFVARDRLGEKPLFWATTSQGHLLLASELKALLASGLLQPQLDLNAVDAYLALLYVPPDRTIYQNVHTLLPGHSFTWRNNKIYHQPYWQPTYSQVTVTHPNDLVEELRHRIDQAVKRQMIADVPVGAFLSGGLDSSTVVALMCQHTSYPVQTFSAGFGDLINELPYARAVAKRYQTDHHELEMDIPVGNLLERMAKVYDQPFADSSNIPTYLISQFAQRHVKVVLSGDGGDELFGGYEWYRWLYSNVEKPTSTELLTLKLQGLALRVLAKLGAPVCALRDQVLHTHHIAHAQLKYPDIWERHLALSTHLQSDRKTLWDKAFSKSSESSIQQSFRPQATVTALDRATDFDLRCYLPGDILVKVDRATMAHGLESRSPFLDADLVEFVLNLPWQLRFQKDTLKPLLRQAYNHLLPQEIWGRSKQGFGAPIWSWIKRSDIQSLVKRVCVPDSPLTNLLPGAASAMPGLDPQQQWTILCLGLWLEDRSECLSILK